MLFIWNTYLKLGVHGIKIKTILSHPNPITSFSSLGEPQVTIKDTKHRVNKERENSLASTRAHHLGNVFF